MISVFRKHMKFFFWGIIILVIPSFVFFYARPREGGSGGGGNSVWGSISGEEITRTDFEQAHQREGEMLQYFLTHIIRDLRYRDPLFTYWQPLRDILAFRAEELGSDSSQQRAGSKFYFVQFGQYQQFFPLEPVTDEQAEAYLKQRMFPKVNESTRELLLDKQKYNAYMKRFGLDEDDMLEEARANIKVEMYITLILTTRDNQDQQFMLTRSYYSMLWERILLARELPKWGLVVTDDEVSAYIQVMLGVTGQEAEDRFQVFLNRRGTTAKKFREEVEENIKIQKLREMIVSGAGTPRYLAKNLFEQENTERKVFYSLIPKDTMKSAVDIDPEIGAYYMDHKDELEDPKTVNVDYLVLKTESFMPLATIADEDIRKEYDGNPDKYKDEDGEPIAFDDVKQEIQRQLIGAKADSLAKAKAASILDQLKAAAADTAAGAQMQSIADKNGLVLFQSGAISEYTTDVDAAKEVSAFVTAALGTELGSASSVINVGNGYAILAPTEIHDSSEPSLETAAPMIARKIAEEKAKEFLETTKVSMPERYVVRYVLLSRKYYDADEYKSKVEIDEDMLKREYDLYEQRMLDAKKPVKTYDEMKETLRDQMINREADILFEKDAKEKLAAATVEEFDAISGKFDPPLKIITTDLFGPGAPVGGDIGNSQLFIRQTRETEVGKVSPVFTIPEKGSVVLVPTYRQDARQMSVDEVVELARKPKLTQEETYLLESAGLTKEGAISMFDDFVSALNDGFNGLSQEQLFTVHQAIDQQIKAMRARNQQVPPFHEGISIKPTRKVQYICIETEDIRPYLNKPFDFEVQDYYTENSSEFFDSETGRRIPFSEAKDGIVKTLTEEREKSFETAINDYYKKNKKEFAVVKDGRKSVPELKDVRDKVAEKVTEQRLMELSRDRAESLKLPSAQVAQMVRIADREGLVLRESDYFTLDDESRIDSFLTGEEKDFRIMAAYTPLGRIASRPIKTAKGYCILATVAVKPYEPWALKDFAEARNGIIEFMKSYEEENTQADIRQYLDEQIAQMMKDDEMTFQDAAESMGLELKETGFFTARDEDLEGFEEEDYVPQRMSSYLMRRRKDSQPLEFFNLTDGNVLVFHPLEERVPTEKEFMAQENKYKARSISERGAALFEDWLHSLAVQSSIEPTRELQLEQKFMESRSSQASATN